MKDWSAFDYKKDEGCTVTWLGVIGLIAMLTVVLCVAALATWLVTHAWEWALE